MALTEAAGLELIANEAVFIDIISNLDHQVKDLGDLKGEYVALYNRIDSVWHTSDGESESYKSAINEQINNINLTLESVNSALNEFGKLDENLHSALNSVKELAGQIEEEAKDLFA